MLIKSNPASRTTEGNSNRTRSTGGAPPSSDVAEKSLGGVDGTSRASGGTLTATGIASDGIEDRSARVGHRLEIIDKTKGAEGKPKVGTSHKRSDRQ